MLRYKRWKDSKREIEQFLISSEYEQTDEEVLIESGLQLRKTISHSPSPVFSSAFCGVTKKGYEKYLINYMSCDGGESLVADWICKPSEGRSKLVKKTSMRNCLKKLIWIPSQHAFVGVYHLN